MKREIKFRGLRTDGNGWVYGDLVRDKHLNGVDILFFILTEEAKTFDDVIPVIPESVGQFTGLHDKNGVEIYEGDIDDNGDVVSWCNNRQGWSMCVFEDSTFKNKAICHCYNCEGNFDIYEVSINIVSNIHES